MLGGPALVSGRGSPALVGKPAEPNPAPHEHHLPQMTVDKSQLHRAAAARPGPSPQPCPQGNEHPSLLQHV